ncbi:MAG: glutathione S-transferase family protein [Pseudomonadota bacterium]
MELFWCPKTRASRAVWILEEAGCTYTKTLIDIRDEDAKAHRGFLAASPMGKVPALADGDAVLADSSAICLYVADRYASGTLAPAINAPERAQFLFWMLYAGSVMEPCMAEGFGTAQANRSAHGWGDFASMVETLEARLASRPWIMGEDFCAADVMIGSTAGFMKMFGILPESHVIESYLKRCSERPAYQRSQDEPELP